MPTTSLAGWGRIEPVAKILRLGDPDPDDGFWLSRPLAERVTHVWDMQRAYYGALAEAEGAQMTLGPDLHDFLSLCVQHDLRFLVIGGHAVAAHGYSRFTKDLDIWIWVDPENAHRMVKVIDEFGFSSVGLTEADFTVAGGMVQLGVPPFRVDILTSLSGVEFESCWERRHVGQLDDIPVPFISYEDLVLNKMATGRPRDSVDVDDLHRHRAAAAEKRRQRDTTGLDL